LQIWLVQTRTSLANLIISERPPVKSHTTNEEPLFTSKVSSSNNFQPQIFSSSEWAPSPVVPPWHHQAFYHWQSSPRFVSIRNTLSLSSSNNNPTILSIWHLKSKIRRIIKPSFLINLKIKDHLTISKKHFANGEPCILERYKIKINLSSEIKMSSTLPLFKTHSITLVKYS